MRVVLAPCLLFSILMALSCSSVPNASMPRAFTALAHQVDNATKPIRRSWQRLAATESAAPALQWDWKSAIPAGVPRAELFVASIPAQVAAYFLPDAQRGAVQLASTNLQLPTFRITNIEGTLVYSCNDLYVATERAVEVGKPVQIDLLQQGAPSNSPGVSVVVEPQMLVAIGHTVAENQSVMRVAEDGNPWLVIRDGGVRAKLTLRAECGRGLVQVVVSLVNCWGDQILLPTEIRATCDGKRLRCLTVAETLEILYGDGTRFDSDADEPSFSFAATSEREDYLIPVNYQQLVHRTANETTRTATPRIQPAFAWLPGVAYPGSPVLGDARALSGFLLQRSLHQVGTPEQTGWVIFGGKELRDGGSIEIALDLGSGLRSYVFQVPSRKK